MSATLTSLRPRARSPLTSSASPTARAIALYARFGPILFSHFFRATGDEGRAVAATSAAFERLVASGLTDDREVVSWVRGLDAGSFP
ncbi:MAG: hypothetical protein INH41_28745 [Myxococcaceae bacterium]|jgi:hypothetical protein|nr:hypothetical protein [Myxococcaceae bacterium]MCA3016391.1 hypothetical protein [Myxococcaceae bacterium]